MRRLDSDGEIGSTATAICFRLPQKTSDRLDALIANMPYPIGPPPRSMVLRAVIELGIETLANREGIKLETETPKPSTQKPVNAKAVKAARPAKTNGRATKKQRATAS